MNPVEGYEVVRVGNISPTKLKRAYAGNAIRLTANELSGNRVMVVHPLNAKAIKTAKLKGKGLSTRFSHGEAQRDLAYHESAGGSLEGGSLWSWLKGAAKSVYSFGKKNWNHLKPIASQLADIAVPFLATSVLKAPSAAFPARALLKDMTGVGMAKKGSPEMKQRMAALRARRKTGGSFRTP